MATLYFIGTTGSLSWSTGANWSTGSAPANGDIVFLNSGNADIDSGLAQSAVTLASLTISSGFSGTIGTAGDTGTYLAIGITTLNIIKAASGSGFTDGGITRFKWNPAAVAFTANITTSGQSADDNRGAIQIKGGTNASVLNITGGSVDLAAKPGETATLLSMKMGGTATVVCGPGLTCPTIEQEDDGSTLIHYGGSTTLVQNKGTLYTAGTAAHASLYVNGAAYLGHRPPSADTIGTLTIDTNGIVDTTVDPREVRFTNPPDIYEGGTLKAFSKDQLKLTGPADFAYDCVLCGSEKVNVTLGQGYRVTVTP